MSTVAVMAACGGGGGSSPPPPPPGPNCPSPKASPASTKFSPATLDDVAVFVASSPQKTSATVRSLAGAAAITISGVARYDSVPALPSGALNYAQITQRPIRGATVQLLDAAGNVLATTVSDAQGNYSFNANSGENVRVRVRAELKDTDLANGAWDMTVRDNTASDALYVLDGALSIPTANETRDLLAVSGWNGSGYTTGQRRAAPFAVLDVAYQGLQKVLSAKPDAVLPALQLFWSPNNVTADGDLASGQIGTSFYFFTNGQHKLYLLGQENNDTDEYDAHVVAHEFGHYLQKAVSSDDSLGGPHGGGDRLDMRVAFSEGWGNGWSGVALNNPRYTDSQGQQQGGGFFIDVSNANPAPKGWYSESSVQYLIWSLNADAGIGFTPIYNALAGLRSSKPFTSIYSFAAAAKAAGANAATVNSLWQTQQIFGTDAYGSGETNFGNVSVANPVYHTHSGTTQQYCISGSAGEFNKLGNSAFVRFTTTAGNHTLTLAPVNSTCTTDPDFYLVTSTGSRLEGTGTTTDNETRTFSLPAGEHVISLMDYNMTAGTAQRCFNFTVN